MTTPVKTSDSVRSVFRTAEAITLTNATAPSPPAKAAAWILTTGHDRKMPTTVPKPAPAETPRMSGETSGLRNSAR